MSVEKKRSQANIDDILSSIREIIADGDPGVLARKRSAMQPEMEQARRTNGAMPGASANVADTSQATDAEDEDDAILDLSEDFIVAPADSEKWDGGYQMPIPGDGPAELVDTVFRSAGADAEDAGEGDHDVPGFREGEPADPWSVEPDDEPPAAGFDATETYKLARAADRVGKPSFWSHRAGDPHRPGDIHGSASHNEPADEQPNEHPLQTDMTARDQTTFREDGDNPSWPDDEAADTWTLHSRTSDVHNAHFAQSGDFAHDGVEENEIVIDDDAPEDDHTASDAGGHEREAALAHDDEVDRRARPPAGFVQHGAQDLQRAGQNHDPAAEIEAAFGRRLGTRPGAESYYTYESDADIGDYEPSATQRAKPAAVEPPAPSAPRSLEDSVKDLLRPMLADWLNRNMPTIVEKAVREELQAQRSGHDEGPGDDDWPALDGGKRR